MDRIAFTSSDLSEACVLEVDGELDFTTVPRFEAELNAAAQRRPVAIVDLRRCRYCDSTALTAFVRARHTLGRGLRFVVAETGQVRRVFDLTQLTQVLGPGRAPADVLDSDLAAGGSATA